MTTGSLTTLSLGGNVDARIDPPLDGFGSMRVVLADQATLASSALSVDTFSAAVRDRGTLTLAGRVKSIDIEADDNAVVDLEGLAIADATVTAAAAARVLLGETTVLSYRQSGAAQIRCGAGTEILPGSRAEVPQCDAMTLAVPDSESVRLPER